MSRGDDDGGQLPSVLEAKECRCIYTNDITKTRTKQRLVPDQLITRVFSIQSGISMLTIAHVSHLTSSCSHNRLILDGIVVCWLVIKVVSGLGDDG